MSSTIVQPATPEKPNEGDTRTSASLSTPPAPTSEAKPTDAKPAPATPAPAKDTKPDATKGDAKGDKPAADSKPEGVPETYADFQFPEGTEAWGKGVVNVFGNAAKEAGLTQTQAQKFIERMAPAYLQTVREQMEAQATQWAQEATHDKEFGGDKLKASMDTARRVFNNEQLVPPMVRELLQTYGLDTHPEFIRMFVRFGSRVVDDKVIAEGTPEAGKVDISDPAQAKTIMYPKAKTKK